MPSRAESRKQRALDEINAQLNQALSSGVEWNGRLWHTDYIFQSQLTAFISAYATGLIPAQLPVAIRGKDNTINYLTLDQLKQLAGAVMLHVQSAYAASWAAKDAL